MNNFLKCSITVIFIAMTVPGAYAGLFSSIGRLGSTLGNWMAIAAVAIADYTVKAGQSVVDYFTTRSDPTPEYITDAVKREKKYRENLAYLTRQIKDHIMFPYDRNHTRGDAGKILFIGGSDEFSGALYFGAITALKTGADVVYVMTTEMAAPIIRRFSPDLRVYPYLNYDLKAVNGSTGIEIKNDIQNYETEKMGRYDNWSQDKLNDTYLKNIEKIKNMIKGMDVIVLGLGMSKDDRIEPIFKIIVEYCREIVKPLIITHHGIYWVYRNASLIKDWHNKGVILVCNKKELMLFKHGLEKAGYTGLYKIGKYVQYYMTGRSDYFLFDSTSVNTHSYEKLNVWYMKHGGSGRRSAGQGHMVAGAFATYLTWTLKSKAYMIYDPDFKITGVQKPPKIYSGRRAVMESTYATSLLIRKCNELAHARYGRSMITSNMIAEIHMASEILFETNSTALRKPKPEHCEFDTSHEFGHIPVEDKINATEEILSSTTEYPPPQE